MGTKIEIDSSKVDVGLLINEFNRACEELDIMYELADKMYDTILDNTLPNVEPNKEQLSKSAYEYDEWRHAGDPVPEEEE